MTLQWRSKLGQDFDKSFIEQNDRTFKNELDRLRKLPENKLCVDCGSHGTVWASVNIGVFLCLRCGSIHRGLGTHVSVPKGCTGTYLWGPDELDMMRAKGNSAAREIYGGDASRPHADASDDRWKQFIHDKYVGKKFASSQMPSSTSKDVATAPLVPNMVNDTNQRDSTSVVTSTSTNKCTTAEVDLMSFDDLPTITCITNTVEAEKSKNNNPDFFAEFGL
jgi:hypothetical protein